MGTSVAALKWAKARVSAACSAGCPLEGSSVKYLVITGCLIYLVYLTLEVFKILYRIYRSVPEYKLRCHLLFSVLTFTFQNDLSEE